MLPISPPSPPSRGVLHKRVTLASLLLLCLAVMGASSTCLHPLLANLLDDLGVGLAAADGHTLVSRDALADAIGCKAEKIADGLSRGAHAATLALALLAEQHHLDEPRTSQRSSRAEHHLGRCLSRWSSLRSSTLTLARDAYHRIACEPGVAAFVRAARLEVEALDTLDPFMIDIDMSERMLLGGRPLRVPYRDPAGAARMRRLSSGNREGRLLLLLAADRGPRVVDADLVSRLRQALNEPGMNGPVRLEGTPPRLVPPLKLTARARALASEVRGVRE